MKNAREVLVVASAIALACAAGGCAILKGGPSDEEMLGDLLDAYVAAMQEGDAETLIGLLSENYESERGTYEEVVERMREFVPRLAQWDVDISADDAYVEIEGDTARVGPIVFESDRGVMSTTLNAAKEDDGCWRVTGREWERAE